MSHYATVQTELKSEDALVAALEALQTNWKGNIQVFTTTTMPLFDYVGKMRKDRANIIVPRKFVGGLSNDIGFLRQVDGTYSAIISDYDRNSMHYDDAWLAKLKQQYALQVVLKQQKARGYTVTSQKVREDGAIELLVEVG